MEYPFVDVILGDIPGARAAQSLDINWVPALAVQTRAQAKQTTPQTVNGTPSPRVIGNRIRLLKPNFSF